MFTQPHQLFRATRLPACIFLIALAWLGSVLISSPASTTAAAAQEARGAITGTVKNASGAPVGGAMIKFTDGDRRLTVSVFSQEDGRFRAPNVPVGNYSAQAIGGRLKSKDQPAMRIEAGRAGDVDLVLNVPVTPADVLTGSHYAEVMPEGKGKDLALSMCSQCHPGRSLGVIVNGRRSAEGWRAAFNLMGELSAGALMHQSDLPDMMAYLTEHFSPSSKRLPSPTPELWAKGEARKAVIVEYQLPKFAYAHDVSVDSKGIAWLCERNNGFIGRFDPDSLTYTRIPVPFEQWGGGQGYALNAIAVDDQDGVWVADGGLHRRLLRYDPKSDTFRIFRIPVPPQGRPGANTIRFHPDGSVWFTQIAANQVLRLDPKTAKFTEFPVPIGSANVPTPKDGLSREGHGTGPYGMALDAKHNVWFVESTVDRVSRLDPKTGKIDQYGGFPLHSTLKRMDSDQAGNMWVGAYGLAGTLAMVDSNTGKITEYQPPTKYSGPYSVSVDKTRNYVWVNQMTADQIARFDPRTKIFVEYPLPSKFSFVRRIEVDQNRPNRVWYNGWFNDTVGYVELPE